MSNNTASPSSILSVLSVSERVRFVEDVRRDGYAVVPDALTRAELDALLPVYDRLMAIRRAELPADARHVEVRRFLERDPLFAALMDHPRTFPIPRSLIGADITLASGGEGDFRPPRTPAYISWHNDFTWMRDVPYPRQNAWIRCTFFLDDVSDDIGPFTLLPGSHLSPHACPTADYTLPDGQPKELPGMVRITGKAGTCLINNTEIWHTNTPNRSDRPRKLIMVMYKHAWMRPWEDGYEISRPFAEAQTNPIRQQLCGNGLWHRVDGKWEADAV